MSYENAPSTILLATHCAVCARPLRDAKSVEIGMGPDCRAKYGFDVEIDAESRAVANHLIQELACERGASNPRSVWIMETIMAIANLGLIRLAEILGDRIAPVKISKVGADRVGVDTPYSEEIVNALRNVPGRYWDRELKLNTYPDQREIKGALWSMIKRVFPGAIVRLPSGDLMLAQ